MFLKVSHKILSKKLFFMRTLRPNDRHFEIKYEIIRKKLFVLD
jgi:hypothetical protein